MIHRFIKLKGLLMKEEYSAISFRGTKKDKQLIALAAKIRFVTVGDLVREAVFAHISGDLEKVGIFFPKSDSQNFQNENSGENVCPPKSA